MRIGILTFHGSHNYGSVLQAYALSTWLKDAGHETEIINLRNAAQKRAYRVFQVKGKGIKRILHAAFAVKNYPAVLVFRTDKEVYMLSCSDGTYYYQLSTFTPEITKEDLLSVADTIQ